MRNCSQFASDITVGLDLGDRKSHLISLGSEGRVESEARVMTTPKGLKKELGAIKPCRVAIEVGTHSGWVSRLLKEWGHEVIVANPRQVPLIFQNRKKTDRTDAECLARLARVDPELLRPIQHRSEGAQQDLALIRSRDVLVRTRTKLISHARGIAKCFGFSPESP
jgi:transposase